MYNRREVESLSYESLDKDQLNRLVSTSRKGDFLDKLLVTFTGYLGLREQEILHLRADWIDFQTQTVNIPAEDEDWPPEGVKTRPRTIPYGDLDKRLVTDIEYFFRDHDELDTSKATIHNRIKKLAAKADIRTKVTVRKLRNTAAERWADQVENMRDLQKLMGYEGFKPTEKFLD